eukprot:5025928-Pleurochrysis_carterae.AAC.2
MLIRNEAELGYDEETASGTLCSLARKGDLTSVQILLKGKCPVDAADYDGRRETEAASIERLLLPAARERLSERLTAHTQKDCSAF